MVLHTHHMMVRTSHQDRHTLHRGPCGIASHRDYRRILDGHSSHNGSSQRRKVQYILLDSEDHMVQCIQYNGNRSTCRCIDNLPGRSRLRLVRTRYSRTHHLLDRLDRHLHTVHHRIRCKSVRSNHFCTYRCHDDSFLR